MNQTFEHLRRTERAAGVRLIVVASIYAFLTIGFVTSIMHGPTAPRARQTTEPASLPADPLAMR